MKTLEDTNKDFLTAILANPNDNNVRAVYADWLESNGKIKEANYLRLDALKKLIIETEEASKELKEHWKSAVARVTVIKCPRCGGDPSFLYNGADNSAYCPSYQCNRSFSFSYIPFTKYRLGLRIYLRLDGSDGKWWKRDGSL